MITGEIRNKIDAIRDTFWTSEITKSITAMTYLFFIKILDDAQIKQEAAANRVGANVDHPTFPQGNWTNPQTGNSVPYENSRWSRFKDLSHGRI